MLKKSINYTSFNNMTPNFEELYNNLQISNIKEISSFRNYSLCFYLFFIIFLVCFLFLSSAIFKLIFFILTLTFFILAIYYKRKYTSSYKNVVISSFVRTFNKDLSYSQFTYDNTINENFDNADFNVSSYNKFYAEDYIKGYLDKDTFIRMAEVKLEKEEKNYKSKNTYMVKVFQGIFAFTASIKNINSCLKISLNSSSFSLRHKNAIEMDSSNFEKYFDVYSSNELLTMRILTHDVMDTLVNFYTSSNIPFEITIKDKCIYLRFFTGAVFEPKIFRQVLDKKLLYKNYCILNFVLDVSRNINNVLKEIEL